MSDTVVTSHMWLLSTWDVASVVEKLFLLHFIVINFKWPHVAAIQHRSIPQSCRFKSFIHLLTLSLTYLFSRSFPSIFYLPRAKLKADSLTEVISHSSTLQRTYCLMGTEKWKDNSGAVWKVQEQRCLQSSLQQGMGSSVSEGHLENVCKRNNVEQCVQIIVSKVLDLALVFRRNLEVPSLAQPQFYPLTWFFSNSWQQHPWKHFSLFWYLNKSVNQSVNTTRKCAFDIDQQSHKFMTII